VLVAVVVLALGLKEEKQERGRQVVLLVSECLMGMGMVVRREGLMGQRLVERV